MNHSILALRLTLALMGTVGLSLTACAQWPARFDGTGGAEDTPTGIKLDGAGNVYVSGTTRNAAGNSDLVLLKYDSGGVLQWTRSYDGGGNEASSCVAVDSAGNATICGAVGTALSGDDYIMVKYDSSGVQQWARQYNGPASSHDFPTACALDASGNLFVTGYTQAVGTDRNYATVKYSGAGVFQWARIYDGTGASIDEPAAMAMDSAGNAVVTGRSVGATTDFDYATVKYSPTGVKLWARRYDGPAHTDDSATCIAIDALDDIFVGGNSIGSSFSTDYFVRAYFANGATYYSRRISTPGEDYLNAIAVVPGTQEVVVTGTSGSDIETMNYLTVKIDGDGLRVWSKTLSGHMLGFGSEDAATDVGIDSSGNVYVTGHEQGDGTLFNYNYFTLKYTPDGTNVYKKKYDGPGHVDDFGWKLAVTPTGTVYVTGFSQSAAGSYDIVTVKY